jgi:16S rRNA processing protein RimM
MIKREDLVKIGQFKKPHGVKGEIAFTFTNDSFEESECAFFVCEIDGIFVPFRVENCRFISGTTAHVQLKDIKSDQKVRFLSNREVFFSKQYIQEDIQDESFTWDYFIGFTLIDERAGKIGRIADVDDSTLNTLFIIEKDEEELLIPAVEEMITHINEDQKELFVDLPEGLIE